MACIKWSQPILTSFGWYAILTGSLSQRSLSGNPRIDPFFSPLLNHTFWKPWPAAHLSCIGWVQVSGALAFCACSTPFEFISFWPSHYFCCLCVYLILLYMPASVYLLWREGCVGYCVHILFLLPLLGLGVAWTKAFILLSSPSFPFLWPWAFWPLILPYHFMLPTITLSLFLFLITSWAYGLTLLLCQPTSSSIFYLGLPWLTFHIFTSFGLCWPTFLLCQPISLLHIGLPWPIYFFFTSFYSHGFKKSFLKNSFTLKPDIIWNY